MPNLPDNPKPHVLDRLVGYSLQGGLPLLVFVLSIALGVLALLLTPREEEPQIVVPMANVLVSAPGLSAVQIENQVTQPLEKLLTQISGVENVYSRTVNGQTIVTLRFFVGEDREDALLNVYSKLYSNQDKIPAVVANWLVKPVEVDDVPIVIAGLWSSQPDLYGDYELRRFADELTVELQQIKDTNQINVIGGRLRSLRVLLNPQSLAARHTTALDVVAAIRGANQLLDAGIVSANNTTIRLEAGDFLTAGEQLGKLVVNRIDGVPVYLTDVADIQDGPAEPDHYNWLGFAPAHPLANEFEDDYPLVTLAVAKKRGANAVTLAANIHKKLGELSRTLLPPEVHVEVLRDYGQTANDKVNDLVSSLGFAIATVVLFIGIFLGWRPALVVGLAIPICYGATLLLDMAFGYTINRVTLFALILALGLLVDDPITGIDNIERFMRQGSGIPHERIVAAMAEIRPALLMSTLTIILAFIPLAFITGMMGPYMAPMAFNVPVAVMLSTVVAFIVTPWLAAKALKPSREVAEDNAASGLYARMVAPCIANRRAAWYLILLMLVLFVITAMLPVLRMVPLKLLPFDNKDEMQIIIDMPERASLEQTAAVTRQAAQLAAQLPEIAARAAYVGLPSPIDFNGLVRQYDYRLAPNLADIRLTLAPKARREHQSHPILMRLRALLAPLNTDDVSVKVVEVPPGPPVISTLVAELYGRTLTPYAQLRQAAGVVMRRLAQEPFVVDIDSSVESAQTRWRFVTNKEKAALSGIDTQNIAQTLSLANRGATAGYFNQEREIHPVPIQVRLPAAARDSRQAFGELPLRVQSRAGPAMISLAELGEFVESPADQAIYHKDLKPVVYVMAELEGRTPAEVIADVAADLHGADASAAHWTQRTFFNSGGGIPWQLPDGVSLNWGGEGEWKVTVEVFRDMGLAFAFALLGIFFVLRLQTASTSLSLIIMSAIPLTVIGIMPGFWLLNQFGERSIDGSPEPVLFTATAMIGMIALAGIVVRNSLILVEFITQARNEGLALRDALLQAGSVRMRPVLLTAGTTLLGNIVIVLDPVFSGLAIAIIFGIIGSTLFTLFAIPAVYYLIYSGSEA
ncbi:efflux RND transporter permease subunit [Methylomonas sp. SURF-2]|uniref:Efflux RND transporter permease subunit n=1 Tax=Methylomonas subterranea TaxID=2952225 RepID=A0ABT1TGY2_9GAMM|nr:efflux RND transporter permease subunit [Methylomonas sp. SURF-2]MCQ8104712.1 efflux RND transporter permease subunit [Methylomonas sp. SURF-2]